MEKEAAAYGTSLFWIAITFGRLLAIYLAFKYTTK